MEEVTPDPNVSLQLLMDMVKGNEHNDLGVGRGWDLEWSSSSTISHHLIEMSSRLQQVEIELVRQREEVARMREETTCEQEATAHDREAVPMYIARIAQAMPASGIRNPKPPSNLSGAILPTTSASTQAI
ncbi:hypothetical protein D8674_017901 [Pyrus ussuriensis x Pyrus communis]|uniref:Uncharacterized protein n=1 Tax=Pyrus ussuriensis x Pyrus communis TaxID=2448454 RepID=A0A5N5HJ67_9ROSA|nr:hypothetical protein D8674_017901 [Pyrus ussuriensis x Pyrus communis]